jgi:predicted transcriptional regulator
MSCGELLNEVLNYKRNKHLYTPLERKKIKHAIRKKIDSGYTSFINAIDDLNRMD